MVSSRTASRLMVGALCLTAIPSDSFAGLHFAPSPFDATTLIPMPTVVAPFLDASPSIAASPGDTWLAWTRSSTAANASQAAIVVARVDPTSGPQSGPPSLLVPNDLADVALAHDGSRFLAAYTRSTDAIPTGADMYLWPVAPGTDPTTNLLMAQAPGRSLDLNIAPLVRNDGIPFVLAFFDSMHGLVTATGSFATNATHTAGITLHPTADTTHFEGRAARAGLESIFTLTSDTQGALTRNNTASWATVPSAIHVAADLVVRTADVVVAAASGLQSVRLTAIDRADPHATTPAWPADVPVTGTLREIALAGDLRGGEWLVTLSNDVRLGMVLDVSARRGMDTVTLANPQFAICQRLHIAPFANDHDALAITAQCGGSVTDLSHVIVWIVHRDLPVPDAGTDAEVDASDDAAEDDVAADTMAVDAVTPEIDGGAPGTGPSFRGSGCSCSTAFAPQRSTSHAVALLMSLFALTSRTRRDRRSPSRNT